MSKATDALRELKIHNDYNLTEKGDYFVWYSAPYGRFPIGNGWRLHKRGFSFKKSHWAYNGDYPLNPMLNGRDLEKALTKAAEITGITRWARTPFGSWMQAERLEELLQAYGVKYSPSRIVEVQP